jgi:hypothetical protein
MHAFPSDCNQQLISNVPPMLEREMLARFRFGARRLWRELAAFTS